MYSNTDDNHYHKCMQHKNRRDGDDIANCDNGNDVLLVDSVVHDKRGLCEQQISIAKLHSQAAVCISSKMYCWSLCRCVLHWKLFMWKVAKPVLL